MPQNAHSVLRTINENPEWLETKIKTFWPRARLKKFTVLKDKFIIGQNYKITGLADVVHAPKPTVILEIHDDPIYFKRVNFVLSKLDKLTIRRRSPLSQLYLADTKNKIIFRQDMTGLNLEKFFKKSSVSIKKKKQMAEDCALWIAQLHNRPKAHLPRALIVTHNLEIEQKILGKTLEFLKPNIEEFRPAIEKNLNRLIELMQKEARLCLTHGDFQLSNLFVSHEQPGIIDYDTTELGHPGRDIGRYLVQVESLLTPSIAKAISQAFIKKYFSLSRFSEAELEPSIRLHRAEMLQYIMLGEVWDKRVPDKENFSRHVLEQTKLLSSFV